MLEVKTLLVGCQAMQSYNAELAAKVTDVALDGLRANRK
ncbi:TetR family transcriptional regulator [Mycobacterium tuberculosis]|nr:TetR family transcriptional regulator [Mycobacterium tuberculosis]